MGTLASALGLLRDRLEQYTPSEDPGAQYVHDDVSITDTDRTFEFGEPIAVTPANASQGNPVRARFSLVVSYRHSVDTLGQLQTVADDAEDLYRLLAYFPGQEWAKADGYDFEIGPYEVTASSIVLPVTVTYNEET